MAAGKQLLKLLTIDLLIMKSVNVTNTNTNQGGKSEKNNVSKMKKEEMQ